VETRVERLHAHHLRHWLHGGPTDVANMVLLCDTDHGLAHDLDLVMSRREGRLVVTTADGRRVWGAADAVFRDGVAGLTDALGDAHVVGVHPLDTAAGRRPSAMPISRPVEAAPTASITRLLFPDQRPDLPDTMHVNGEPMDLAYVVGLLLANRDLERRLATENAGDAGDAGRLVAVA
jgi:hypothetical protein